MNENVNANIRLPYRFGVPPVVLAALNAQWLKSRAEYGDESSSALLDLARLCIGYGLQGQEVASPAQMWRAVELFGNIASCHRKAADADFEGALTLSALALRLVYSDARKQASEAIAFANSAFIVLEANRANPIDVAGAAHVGALTWHWRDGGRPSQPAAMKALASARLQLVNNKELVSAHPEVLAQHEWVTNVVERGSAGSRAIRAGRLRRRRK